MYCGVPTITPARVAFRAFSPSRRAERIGRRIHRRRFLLAIRRGIHFCDSEIADLHDVDGTVLVVATFEDDDVLGFEIAMENFELVRGADGGERLAQDRRDARGRKRKFARDELGERATFEELHRDVEHAVGVFAEIEDARGVRMIEARRGARFDVKTLDELRVIAKRVWQDFQRDDFLELDLLRAVDDAHRALADDRLNRVLGGDDAADELVTFSHF